MSADVTVIKLGGELLEDAAAIRTAAAALVNLAARRSLVVVHGGGRAVDAELRARGQAARFVDGLRVTDEAALDAAVSVLAGRNNTALVAAMCAEGGRAVGLTGADAAIGLCERARDFRSVAGDKVDLGLVGHPVGQNTVLIEDLLAHGYVPVIASIGVDEHGALLNVNADTLAGHLAAALHARQLIVAGTTPGVLNGSGEPIAQLGLDDVDDLTASGAAHSGMVAKLAACRHAVLAGVEQVGIVDGRAASDYVDARGTSIVSHTGSVEPAGEGIRAGELRA